MKYGSLSALVTKVGKLKDCCSISDYRLQQQKVEELKLRYEQVQFIEGRENRRSDGRMD